MKRLFDFATSALALLVSSPILAGSAAAIVLEDRGPVLYRQRRVGKDGVEFELLKLRTMVVGAETIGAGLAVNEGDPRITKVGAILRRLSLDELPQFWNVLRGEMSIIGPRPTLAYQVERYTPRQRRRLEVKPGITGWAQVRYHYGGSLEDARRKHQFDLYYVKHNSLLLDMLVLLETVSVVLFHEGQ